jgi:hypothetical protein
MEESIEKTTNPSTEIAKWRMLRKPRLKNRGIKMSRFLM